MATMEQAPTALTEPCRVAVCECGWKVVAPADRVQGHVNAHRRPQGQHRGRPARITIEEHCVEHPTMLHADAERIGSCWCAKALAENEERDRRAKHARDDKHARDAD